MKLYFVIGALHTPFAMLEAMGVTRGLVSYWEARKGGFARRLMEYFAPRDLFLDSGAFAAYTQGATITAEEYGEFVRECGATTYANLDVIRDSEGTARNQAVLEAMGLSPLPVFHLGEDPAVLEGMLERYDHLCLGIAQKQNTAAGRHWLRETWAAIVRRWPKRVHGFGMTGQDILEEFPWYSVDSSAADKAGGYGRILTWRGGRMVYESDLGTRPDLLDHRGQRVSAQRKRVNFTALLRLERYVTELWAGRGVAWGA